MILKLMYDDPITNSSSVLILEYPEIDNSNYLHFLRSKNEKDCIEVLNVLINDWKNNAITIVKDKLLCPINSFMYNNNLSKIYYVLLDIENEIEYNNFIQKIINVHKENIVFQHEFNCNKVEQNVPKKKSKKIPNKFFRAVSRDIFTGDTVYIYKNPKTEEVIESKNPDLLEELNKKKTKQRTKKATGYSVPLENITFSFKKK